MARVNGSPPNGSSDGSSEGKSLNGHPADEFPLIQFFGRWFRGEKRAVRAAVEAVEPTLQLGPPSDTFFPSRWHAAVQIRRLGQEPPHRQFTTYRAGHSRVLSALDLDDLCAQIRSLRAPDAQATRRVASEQKPRRGNGRRAGSDPSKETHA